MFITKIIYQLVRGTIVLVFLCGGSTLALDSEAQIPPDRKYEFKIDEPSLEQALIQFASQVGLALYMPSKLVENVKARPLIGFYTVEQALGYLLAGTSIEFELSQQEVLVLTEKPTLVDTAPDNIKIKNDKLDEILVISNKRSRKKALENSSYAIIDATEVIRLQALNILEFDNAVPGLQVKRIGEHNIPNLYLRGIAAFDHTEAGEQSIPYYTDDVLSPRPQGATTILFDIEEVEIVRGPQIGPQGKSAIGGTIRIRNNTPSKEFYSLVDVNVDSNERFGASLAINVPVSDQWALRFSGVMAKQEGDIEYSHPEMKDTRKYGEIDMNAMRISGKYSPSEVNNLLITLERFQDQGTGRIPLQDSNTMADFTRVAGRLSLEQDSIRLRWENSNPLLSFQYIAGFSRFDQMQIWAPWQTQTINRKPWSDNRSIHQELNLFKSLKLRSGRDINLVVGAFYNTEKNSIRFDLQHQDRQQEVGAPIHLQTSFVQPDRGAYTRSLFSTVGLELSSDWFIDIGLRYSQSKRYDKGGRNINCSEYIESALPEPAPQISEVIDEKCWVASYNDVQGRWSRWLGSLHLRRTFANNHSIYIELSNGWKSGSVSDGVDSAITNGRLDKQKNQNNLLQPEESVVFEVGMIRSYLDHALYLQASAFVMDHKNIQQFVYSGQSGQDPYKRGNGAQTLSAGTEIKLNYTPTGRWNFSSAFSLISARYTDFLTRDEVFTESGVHWNDCVKDLATGECHADGQLDLSGNRVPYTPTISMNINASKAFQTRKSGLLTPRIRFFYQSDMYFTHENRGARPAGFIDDNDPGEAEFDMQKGYGKVDFDLEYLTKRKNWGLRFFVKNITDIKVKQGVEINTEFYKSAYYWGLGRVLGLSYFSTL